MKNLNKALLLACAMLLIGVMAFAEGQTATTSGAKKSITWFMRWDNSRVEAVAMPVIDAFQKENPDIEIQFENIGKAADYYTKLTTLAAAEEMPDVTYLAPHYVAIFASKGALTEIDSVMKKYKIDAKAYYQKVLGFYKVGGQVMGLPLDAAALVAFVNEDMFAAAGVKPFVKGWKWSDLSTVGKKFVQDTDGDGTPDQFAIHARSDYWPVKLKADTDHVVTDNAFKPSKYLLTEKESIQSIQEYFDLWLVEKVAPTTEQTTQIKDYFMAGKAATIIVGAWNMPKYIKNITAFKWNLAPLPIGKSGKEYNRGDGSCFAISADSKAKDAAFRFVHFLAGPTGKGVEILLDRQQMLPALVSWAESDRFLKPDASLTGGLKLNKAAYFFGNSNQFSMYDPIHAVFEKVNAVHKSELSEAANGAVSVEEAIKRSAPQIEEIFKEVQ